MSKEITSEESENKEHVPDSTDRQRDGQTHRLTQFFAPENQVG